MLHQMLESYNANFNEKIVSQSVDDEHVSTVSRTRINCEEPTESGLRRNVGHTYRFREFRTARGVFTDA